MNRVEARAAAKQARRPRKPQRDRLNPVIRAVIEADFKKRFTELKRSAETQCLASDDTVQIAADAGYLLFITLRALQLDQFDLEEDEPKEALAIMGNALADISESGVITNQQRGELVAGMDYLDALIQPLSKEAIAIAWHQVEEAARKGDIGTHDLDRLLSRLTTVEVMPKDEPQKEQTMTTYSKLKKEADAMDREIAVAFAIERTGKINEMILAMREYKIQPEDLGHNLKSPPKWVNVKTGDTWTGRGKSPAWVIGEDAVGCGKK